MNQPQINILDLDYLQLKDWLKQIGEPAYRADQILKWVYQKLAASFDDMTDLPQALREKLSTEAILFNLIPLDKRVSRDGQTLKMLFRLDDGKTLESTLMFYRKSEDSRERRTVCVSSQVGCPIGCYFCATGQQGFERNLRPGEIIEQVLFFMRYIQNEMPERGPGMSRRWITNVVFMGMGEPLANYENVKRAVTMLNFSKGLNLGVRQITLSTSGLVPQIRQLAEESLHLELAISLHAAKNELRNKLIPINKKYPLEQLIPACLEYFEKTGRRPTFEYALFEGLNDSLKDADDLVNLIKGMNCSVNLIAGNPTECQQFIPSPMKIALAFQNRLIEAGIRCMTRVSKGTDIEAGYGQLRSRWIEAEKG
jgi:23S rRNA (adenine2503-C2)-methyltransferase